MAQNEVDIENRACERILVELGVDNIKLNIRGNTGWPDRLFFVPGGVPLFIEFKLPGEEPSARQLLVHEFLRLRNYEVEVHDTIEGAFQAVLQAVARARKAKRSKALDTARLSDKGG